MTTTTAPATTTATATAETTTTYANVQKHPRYHSDAAVDVVAGAQIEQLFMENISLGGMFLKTPTPLPKGTELRLRLHGHVPLGLIGRVVHVVDQQMAAAKQHPAGYGVQFEGLSKQTLEQLTRFVDGLAEEARRERARRAAVRFLSPSVVQVRVVDRALLAELWTRGLKAGGLYAEGIPPPLASVVKVHIGGLELQGEVVHIDKGGAGLQLRDLEGAKKQALLRFIDGTSDELLQPQHKPLGAPLEKVLAAARRLFTGIEENDCFGAVGLPMTASDHDVKQRIEALRRVLAVPPPGASPPQQARLAAAARALDKLEPALLSRVSAIRKQAELSVHKPPSVANIARDDEVKALLQRAAVHEKAGERNEARTLLAQAVEIAPDHEGARRRLQAIDETINAIKAMDMLDKAEVFVSGNGMKDDAVRLALEAAKLSPARAVRLRAARALVKSGENHEAAKLCDELIDADPKDQHALMALLIIHERTQSWRPAARVGEQLLRLKPDDHELQKRVKKIIAQARA